VGTWLLEAPKSARLAKDRSLYIDFETLGMKKLQKSLKLGQLVIFQALKKLAEVYKVVSGDTLSSIAKKKYQDANLWPLIALQNGLTTPQSIHIIQIGQSLTIPPKRPLAVKEKDLAQQYSAAYGYGASQPGKDVQTQSVDHPQNESGSTPTSQGVTPTMDLKHNLRMLENPVLKASEVKRLGLVDLSQLPEISIGDPRTFHAHPTLARILQEASKLPYMGGKVRVTEAFPATQQHQADTHYTGQAVDLTIGDAVDLTLDEKIKYAQHLTDWFKNKGLHALNEYVTDTTFKHGDNIHVSL
jgi:LysM repeat protein